MWWMIAAAALAAPDWPQVICEDDAPDCTTEKVQDAGTDAQGNQLSVVTMSGDAPHDDYLVVHRGDEVRSVVAFGGAQGTRGESWSTEAGEPGHWMLKHHEGNMVGWDSNRLVFQLSPLRLVSMVSSSGAYGYGESEQAWYPLELRGTYAFSPDCDEDAEPDEGKTTGVLVPQVTPGAAWADVRLGACAATVDGASAEDVTWGEVGEVGDATMKVLAVSKREVWIEIMDDVLVAGTKSWLYDDHIEIWLANEGADHCDEGKAAQWGIRVSDGEVFEGYGSPMGDPAVERRDLPGGVALKVTLPWEIDRFAVVYSDGDDGGTQERLISTSKVERGWPWSLGVLQKGEPLAGCAAKDGTLQLEDRQDFEALGKEYEEESLYRTAGRAFR